MEEEILTELRRVRIDLHNLRRAKLIRVYDSLPRFLFYNLLRGIAIGFGTVVGATILVSVFVYLLSGIEFIPLIGDWVGDIVQQVQEELGRVNPPPR